MARNRPANTTQQPQADANAQETKPDLQALAQGVTDATAALDTARTGGNAEAIAAAEKTLADATAAFTAASAPAAPPAQDDEAASAKPDPAAVVTAATTEPKAPSAAAPDPVPEQEADEAAGDEPVAEVAELEARVETFVDRLQGEIAAAERSGKAQLHAWLLSLEGHLGGLKRHFETTHPEATAEIQALAKDIKSLF